MVFHFSVFYEKALSITKSLTLKTLNIVHTEKIAFKEFYFGGITKISKLIVKR